MDDKYQRCGGVVPDSIVVRSLHHEPVRSPVEMRVAGISPRPAFNPVLIKPDKFVGVPVLLSDGEIECNEFERKIILLVSG